MNSKKSKYDIFLPKNIHVMSMKHKNIAKYALKM